MNSVLIKRINCGKGLRVVLHCYTLGPQFVQANGAFFEV